MLPSSGHSSAKKPALAKNLNINTTLSINQTPALGNTRYEEALELHSVGAVYENYEEFLFSESRRGSNVIA